MIFFNALQSILSIVILGTIGYILMVTGWFDQKMAKAISRLVVNISLPALMIHNLITSIDREMLYTSLQGLIIPFASIAICYGISFLISGFVVPDPKRGTFEAMFTFSNTIFIGLPVNILLFGEESVTYSLLYYVANTVLFWTIGVIRMGRMSEKNKNVRATAHIRRALLAPPFLALVAGMLFVILDITLPMFLMDTAGYLGNLTTPLSLIFIGMTFHSIKLREIRLSFDKVWVFIGRFAVAPLIVLGLSLIVPVPALMRNVFVIQASMPIMAQVAIISDTYGGDSEYATLLVAMTTLAGIVMIPVYMVLLSLL